METLISPIYTIGHKPCLFLVLYIFWVGVHPRLLFNDIFSNINSAFSISTNAQSRLFAGADTNMLPSSGEILSSPNAVICFRRGSGRGFGADAEELPLDIEDAASSISTEMG